MTTHRFMVRIAHPPTDQQVAQLFQRVTGVCVEVGAFRRWAAVAADRRASRGQPLAADVVAVIRELDAVGLEAIDTGPDCDIAPVWLIAARTGRPVRTVRRWVRRHVGVHGIPDAVELPGRPRYHPWLATARWLATHHPESAPADTAECHLAINRALALRASADRVPGLAGAVAALFGRAAG